MRHLKGSLAISNIETSREIRGMIHMSERMIVNVMKVSLE